LQWQFYFHQQAMLQHQMMQTAHLQAHGFLPVPQISVEKQKYDEEEEEYEEEEEAYEEEEEDDDDSRIRKRIVWPVEKRQKYVKMFYAQSNNLNVSQFAKLHNIAPGTMRDWILKYGESHPSSLKSSNQPFQFRSYSEQERKKLVELYFATPDISFNEFCYEHRIAAASLKAWIAKYKSLPKIAVEEESLVSVSESEEEEEEEEGEEEMNKITQLDPTRTSKFSRYSKEARIELVELYLSLGKPKLAPFCSQNNICTQTLCKWLQKYEEERTLAKGKRKKSASKRIAKVQKKESRRGRQSYIDQKELVNSLQQLAGDKKTVTINQVRQVCREAVDASEQGTVAEKTFERYCRELCNELDSLNVRVLQHRLLG
jgi:transposase-like protein